MSPNLRRALHAALDLVLDAVAEDARKAARAPEAKKARRYRARPPPADLSKIPPETLAKADAALKRAGLR